MTIFTFIQLLCLILGILWLIKHEQLVCDVLIKEDPLDLESKNRENKGYHRSEPTSLWKCVKDIVDNSISFNQRIIKTSY